MIHAWHQQSPYTNACLSEHPNICLQIERFPDLHTKNRMNVDFPRSCVQIPIFARTSGLDVYWAEYRIVSLTLHLGEGPHSGHYQSCLLTSGNLWMTDDDRLPWLSCLHPAMQKDCYLIWLVPQMGLAKFLAPAISQSGRRRRSMDPASRRHFSLNLVVLRLHGLPGLLMHTMHPLS